jgi:prepilin-type N-terminal cleavage/methylation domain-containing protein
MKKQYFIKKGGFTFVETLIVVAIFCIIMTAIYSVYLVNQRAYLAGENMAEITQNGRVILERMVRELRQAKNIISDLPDEKTGAPSEIRFQDGHDIVVSLSENSQGGSSNTIILSLNASSVDDYYKDLYVKIIDGSGQGQVKKIYSYSGETKTATVEGSWEAMPDISSVYKIDSSFYYIHYYKDLSSIYRKLYTYCFSFDGVNCTQPENYVSYNSTPPPGQQLVEITLDDSKVIGEYINEVAFWKYSNVINIFLELMKNDKKIDLQSKVFGRNL